jgi:hypothetical protein
VWLATSSLSSIPRSSLQCSDHQWLLHPAQATLRVQLHTGSSQTRTRPALQELTIVTIAVTCLPRPSQPSNWAFKIQFMLISADCNSKCGLIWQYANLCYNFCNFTVFCECATSVLSNFLFVAVAPQNRKKLSWVRVPAKILSLALKTKHDGKTVLSCLFRWRNYKNKLNNHENLSWVGILRNVISATV